MSGNDKSLESLIQRAASDADFRSRLLADPTGTIDAEGYDVPADTREKMASMDRAAAEQALAALGAVDGDRKAAS